MAAEQRRLPLGQPAVLALLAPGLAGPAGGGPLSGARVPGALLRVAGVLRPDRHQPRQAQPHAVGRVRRADRRQRLADGQVDLESDQRMFERDRVLEATVLLLDDLTLVATHLLGARWLPTGVAWRKRSQTHRLDGVVPARLGKEGQIKGLALSRHTTTFQHKTTPQFTIRAKE